MSEILPNFLIIGAQKSGTTSLTHYLAAHPEVFMPLEEVHYFDRNFDKGIVWYGNHFSNVTAEKAIGEATPEYMYDERVPAYIGKTLKDVRLIAVLRNPVDRAYSHYWHNRTRGHEPLEFAEAIAAEAERLTEKDPIIRARFAYFDRGRYLEQLQRICQYHSRNALLVILFEDLRDSVSQTFQNVCRFLAIRDSHVPSNLGKAKNRFMTFRSMRLRKPIRSLPMPLRRIAARLNVRYGSYPPLNANLRADYVKRYEKENRQLGEWLNRDLSFWNR